MRNKNNLTPVTEARGIELEAIRRAALNPEPFSDGLDKPAFRYAVRLALARRFDKLVEQYRFDTHELLVERLQMEHLREIVNA